MSLAIDSPFQTQMAMAFFNSGVSGEYHGRIEGKPVGSRHVFVQTETGYVMGMELNRSDNAHTVKRKLQLALNVSTEESSLTFGGTELKNDLSAIRNHFPILLTRNLLQRSSSTPCLLPTGIEVHQTDQSGPVVILGQSNHLARTKQLVEEIIKAMKHGIDPIPVHSGLGGAYYFRNIKGECAAIVKPTDEEPFAPNNPKGFVGKSLGQPGLKCSLRIGETGFREVAAYLLDHDHFANVPPTAIVKITHSIFNVNGGLNLDKPQKKKMVSKIASFQQFIPHDFDASDHGTSSFPVAAVHRIGILDVRILNTDRHTGNLLVRKLDGVGKFGQVKLIPIDHGLCLPESLEDPYFEWIHWQQASIPFSAEELEYIEKLDPVRDSEMLRNELPMMREACLRVLVLCTIFLKEAAAFGLCLAEIGGIMSREFRGGEEEPSELELVCIEAQRLIAEREVLSLMSDTEEEEFQFQLDSDEPTFNLSSKMASDDLMARQPYGGVNGCYTVTKLVETIEEKEEIGEGQNEEKNKSVLIPTSEKMVAVSKLSMYLKDTILGENQKHQKLLGSEAESNYLPSSSSGHRSAHEQLPNASFVKLADMNEEEWVLFLDNFQELLYPMFTKRKSMTGQRQRLGTSCHF